MTAAVVVSGVCRYCGCTEERACVLPEGGGETCAWFDADRTVCTGPHGCSAQFLADQERGTEQGFSSYLEGRRAVRAKRLARQHKRKGRAA